MKYQQTKTISLLLASSMLLSACGKDSGPSRGTANNLDWEYYGDDQGIIANPKGVKPGQRNLLSKGVQSVMRVAASYEQAGQYPAALDLYLKTIGRYPGAASPKMAAARIYGMAGEWGAASRLLEAARDIRPDNKAIQMELGQAYMLAGNIRLSRAILNQIPDTDEFAVNKRILLGQGYDLQGDADQAQAYYFQALDLDPRSSEVITNISLSLALNQHFEDAVEMLQTNLSRPSTRDAATENLALIYALSGQPRSALALARASLSDEDLANNLKFYESLPLLDYTDRVRAIFTREIERSDIISRIRDRNITNNEPVTTIADDGNEGLSASEIDESFAAIIDEQNELLPEALLDGTDDGEEPALIVRRGFDDPSPLSVSGLADDADGEVEKQRDAAALIVNREKEISPQEDSASDVDPVNTSPNDALLGATELDGNRSITDPVISSDNQDVSNDAADASVSAAEAAVVEDTAATPEASPKPEPQDINNEDTDAFLSSETPMAEETPTEQDGALSDSSTVDPAGAKTAGAVVEDPAIADATESVTEESVDVSPAMSNVSAPLEIMIERPFRIQFVSVETPEAADDEWCRLHEKIEQSSADLEPVVRRAELDDGSIRYRMLLAGFDDYDAAAFRCEVLQEDGIGCFVVRGGVDDLQPLTSRCKKSNERSSDGR